MATRQEIALSAAHLLDQAAPSLPEISVVAGYDGFVDEIIAVVDKRYDLNNYDRFQTITEFAGRVNEAAGESANLELVVLQAKLGGNGPIMANAMAFAGFDVTYVGNLGYPALHPVFQPMESRMTVHSIAEPGHTDALEFFDGKLMLGKLETTNDVNWDQIKQVVGTEKMIELVSGARLVTAVNWTMLNHMDTIWEGLLTEVLPKVPSGDRTFFFDLADPAKRTTTSLLEALRTLKQFVPFGKVVLGLNANEAQQVGKVLDLTAEGNEALAAAIRVTLEVTCVVIHPREGASAATADARATFAGPFIKEPKISTGAGDHFNAGFCLGWTLGLPLSECLATGTATSGYYVRHAESPTATDLVGFLKDLPEPQ